MDIIKNDTQRANLLDLSWCLVSISKIHWEAKQNLIRNKSEYEREFVMCKEKRKQYLIQEENDRYTIELDTDKKAKRSKITNVDIEHYTELELLSLKKEQEEPALIVAYLDVYIKSIYEWIINLRFMDKANVNDTKFYNEQK